MYHYIFTLASNDRRRNQDVVAENLLGSLNIIFDWYGRELLLTTEITTIQIRPELKSTKSFNVPTSLISKILEEFREQNAEKFFKKECPEDSRDTDPITAEEWEEIPYGEYVKNDKYLSQCYRLSTLLQAFEAALRQEKQDNPFPQWPSDPFTRTKLPPERLQDLLEQSRKVGIDIPDLFMLFMQGVSTGVINAEQGMANPYIGTTDHVNPEFQKFVEQAVDYLGLAKPAEDISEDLALALQLAQELQGEP